MPEPGPGQIQVRIAAASVNPADVRLMTGDFRDSLDLPFPHVPGNDFAGTVSALGEGVTRFAVGEEVFGFATPRALRHMGSSSLSTGAFAEYAVFEAGTPFLAHRPPELDIEQAAALPTVGLTVRALMANAELKPGARVLVVGATGGVGTALLPALRNAGAHVIATARDTAPGNVIATARDTASGRVIATAGDTAPANVVAAAGDTASANVIATAGDTAPANVIAAAGELATVGNTGPADVVADARGLAPADVIATAGGTGPAEIIATAGPVATPGDNHAGTGGDAELVRSLGAAEVCGYEDYPDGVDLAFNLVLPGDRLERLIAAVRPGGQLLTITFPPPAPHEEVDVRLVLDMEGRHGGMAEVARDAVAGELRARIAARYEFGDAVRAIADFERKHKTGKLVVRVRSRA